MADKHEKVLVRKVNIGNFQSPAYLQAKREFGANGIPHVVVFDGDGKKVGVPTIFIGNRIDLSELEGMIENALGD